MPSIFLGTNTKRSSTVRNTSILSPCPSDKSFTHAEGKVRTIPRPDARIPYTFIFTPLHLLSMPTFYMALAHLSSVFI